MRILQLLSVTSLFLFVIAFPARAEVQEQTYEIFGATVSHVRAVQTSDTETVLLATTEGPNTLFQAVVDHSGSTPVIGEFETVPGMGMGDGRGTASNSFEAYYNGTTTCVYLGLGDNMWYGDNENGQLLEVTHDETTISSQSPIAVTDSGDIFFVNEDSDTYYLHWGAIQSDCSVTFNENAPLMTSVSGDYGDTIDHWLDIQLGPTSSSDKPHVYLINSYSKPTTIHHSPTPISEFSSSTNFIVHNTGLVSDDVQYTFAGVAPDGRVWMKGESQSDSEPVAWMQYSNDLMNWTEAKTGAYGNSGTLRIYDDDDGNDSTYTIFGAGIYSRDTGSNWQQICTVSQEANQASGDILLDPNSTSTVYMTTDLGIGVSYDGGTVCGSHNDGLNAVNIEKMYINEDAVGSVEAKSLAWIASTTGIWKSENFNEETPTWTGPDMPNSQTNFKSIAVKPDDPANTVFVGGSTIYKTEDGGTNWNSVFDSVNYETPMNSSTSVTIEALAIDPYYTSNVAVYAGLDNGEPGEGENDAGGLFVSCDAGTTWVQVGLENSPPAEDADVRDILFTQEDGSTVAYVGAHYTEAGGSGPTNATSGVYRVEGDCATDPATWTSTSMLTEEANIYALAMNSEGTVYASGSNTDSPDSAINPAVVYENSSGTFTSMTTDNFPTEKMRTLALGAMPDGTCDGLVPYGASESDIYYLGMDSECSEFDSEWTLYHEFAGAEINVIFWDELVVGTSAGFYGVEGADAAEEEITVKKVKKLKVKKKLRKRKRATATWKKHSYVTVLKLQKWNKKKKKYKKYKTYRVKKNKKKKIMKKLKPKTKYRVRARKRRTVEGIYYYSDWTKWVKFRTKK